jgi:YVTN family beta-propeller protein
MIQAQTVTATIPAGTLPYSVAVNPVTNKIYVGNDHSSNVTVIDGATNATVTVAAGPGAAATAVNPVTNKIYVVNTGNNITVIDGATNNTTTVAAGVGAIAVAVNPVTNKIYVTNYGSNNVTVIDGATNNTSTVAVGTYPYAVAVNPVTNKIYVVNRNSNNVTVIDGATNSTATVAVGSLPQQLAVNPVMNKVYVLNANSANVTVIDGATNSTATVAAGSGPSGVAVNPVTNKVYVVNTQSGNVTVIDGATNQTATVAAEVGANAVAVNPVTNTIYATSYVSNNVTVIDGATNNTSAIAVGTAPYAIAVNPVTNKIYVANGSSNDVTVIDGATNAEATIPVDPRPIAAAVNPTTNKVYVANYSANDVTVINGATGQTTTVGTGSNPQAVAVNPVTNKIYVGGNPFTVIDGSNDTVETTVYGLSADKPVVNPVTNKIYAIASGGLTVIDGATNSVMATLSVGSNPAFVAINPVTNKIYVGTAGGNNIVAIVDGATNNLTATVTVGTDPMSLAVNAVTNKIYVANYTSGSVSVIDGATGGVTATIPASTQSFAIAVNPFTNKIYSLGSSLTVIDGATNAATTIAVGSSPQSLGMNPVTNKIYVGDYGSSQVTVIDGATNTTTTVAAGAVCEAIAVNPITNRVYIANNGSNNVTILTEQQVQPIPLVTAITALPGDQTTSRTPAFTFTATSRYAPNAPTPRNVYFQVDTWQGRWLLATGANPTFTGKTGTLSLGPHILYAYAGDGQEAGLEGSGLNGQVNIGAIAAYPFTVMQAATNTSLKSSVDPSDVGQTVTLTATVGVVAPGTGTPTGLVTFFDGTTSLGSATLGSNLQASRPVATLTAGTHSLTAQYAGDVNFLGSTSSVWAQTVNSAPTVNTTSLPVAMVGTAYSAPLQASGGTTPYTWSIASGSLPPGLNLNSATGVISGTPTTVGTSSFTVSLKDASGVTATSAQLSIKTVAQLTVTTATLPGGMVGTSYSAQLLGTGGTTAYTWSIVSGSLPSGLSLVSVTGVIAGTPMTVGTSSFTVKVTDANNFAATKALTIKIVQLKVPTGSLPPGAIGTAYNQVLQATGGTSPYIWSRASGNLPPGLTLNSGTGAISGTPSTAGTFSFTLSVTDADGFSATGTVSIIIVSQLTITTTSLPAGMIGTAYNQPLQAAGGTTPYKWSLASGALPPGLSMNSATGAISGTPTTAATSSFTVSVTDANNFTATSSTLSIVVVPQLAVTTTSLPAGMVGRAYSQAMQAAGGTAPYTWTIATGSLPAGLNLSTGGTISGTPTAAGTPNFTVSLKDANNLTVTSSTLSIVVVSQLAVMTTSLPAGAIRTAYSQVLQAAGGTPPYAWSIVSVSLPPGLSLNSATGTISGTPTTAGNSSFSVSVKDANSFTATSSALGILVVSRLAVTTPLLPGSTVGTEYSQVLQASGGTAPYTWTIASGSLPAGLSLSAGGTISGTPTTAGISSFTVTVKDVNSLTATSPTLSIAVVAQVTVTTANLPGGVIGTAYSQALQAAGGTAPYTWTITSGSLPPGLSLNNTTGIISGTPTTAGTFNTTVSVADPNGLASISGPLSVGITAPPNAPTCKPPTVQGSGTDPLTVTASSNCSDPQITSTVIDWGDGSPPLTGTTGTHKYAAGTYSITVNATNASNLSNSASESVTVSAPVTTTVPQGQVAQVTQSVTAPLGVPTVQVTYQCSSVNGPGGDAQSLAFYHLSCNINGQGATATVTLTGTPTPVSVTVQTAGSTAGMLQPDLRRRNAGGLYAAILIMPGIALLGIGRLGSRRRKAVHCALLVFIGLLMWNFVACGGGGGHSSQPNPTPPVQQNSTPTGAYAVTVTGTSSTGSQSTITVGFTVTIHG